MMTFVAGAIVAMIFVCLLALVVERGQQVQIMSKSANAWSLEAEKAKQAEKDLRLMIEQFNGRPFVIHLSDAQIMNLAQMLISAMPNAVKSTHIQ